MGFHPIRPIDGADRLNRIERAANEYLYVNSASARDKTGRKIQIQ